MSKFKTGDKVVIKRSSSDKFWYSDRIGEEFTITALEDTVDHPTIGWIERYTLEETDHGVIAGIDAELADDQEPASVITCPAQIRFAAEFIEENNKFINDSVDDIEDKIYSYIRDQAVVGGEKSRFVGTMGFLILFSHEREDLIEADVYVDPAVSEHSEFVKLKLDSNSNFVAQYPNR